jgi:hypothetical protein
MHCIGIFSLNGMVLSNLDLNVAASHLRHRGLKLSALVLV